MQDLTPGLPLTVETYFDALVGRLREVVGRELVGVYVGGSYALGAYEAGRSDLDVAAVVAASSWIRTRATGSRSTAASSRSTA